MAVITEKNYHDCYQLGTRVYNGKLMIADAIKLAENMNPKSARAYISCVEKMLRGEVYLSTVKKNAVIYFLEQIHKELGNSGLQKALNSLALHLHYQKDKNGLPSLWLVHEEFSKKV